MFYYFSDHLKTASVITDSGGVIKAESDYYPWGGEIQFVNNDSNDYKFTGKKRDIETGLDYFGARYYLNGLGRWVSADLPFADQHAQNPQSWNLYMYAGNRPSSLIDTDGREVKEVAKTVTYNVSGKTAGEALANAPSVSGIAGGYRGNTDTNIGVGPYTFKISAPTSGPSGTTVTDTVKSAEVDLMVTITLPSWDGYNNASPEEQKQWDSAVSALQDHENGHKEIAEKAANDLDKSLPGTKATGTGKNQADAKNDAKAKLGAKIEDKHQAAVQDAQKKTDAYDKKTEHGAHQERKNDPD